VALAPPDSDTLKLVVKEEETSKPVPLKRISRVLGVPDVFVAVRELKSSAKGDTEGDVLVP
jgi:hypothetical protein